MLVRQGDYDTTCAAFRWDIPARLNMAVVCCDRWADGSGREALIYKRRDGGVDRYSFDDLKRQSNQLANALVASGIQRGDRVGILLGQSPETALTHLAVYKLGGIAVPLFTLFGVEAIEHRLTDCGMKAVVTDSKGLATLHEIRDRVPSLETVYLVDDHSDDTVNLHDAMAGQPEDFAVVDTDAEDPALIIYTSGTTGKPKGALHAHRTIIGHLTGVQFPHNYFPQPGDMMWTPADWAWIGGLMDVLMPAWYFGMPVVAHRFEKFDGEKAFALLEEFPIRNVFLPPTALKLMRAVDNPKGRWNYRLRSVASGGESLGLELLDWGRETFGLTINEFYGQTECNIVVGSCADQDVHRPGCIGKAMPGHTVAIVDDAGNPVPDGTLGNIAFKSPDPVMFLGYWNRPEATREKFVGEWMLSGDQGIRDSDGYIRFVGRDDDVITSAGYRIGPGPIEDCLLGHPAVRMAAVVGKPDPERTEIVKAFIVLNEGYEPSEALKTELQARVRTRLAAHEYPREIAFVDDFPMTNTGKIIRRALREA